jgi:hypothetical protein
MRTVGAGSKALMRERCATPAIDWTRTLHERPEKKPQFDCRLLLPSRGGALNSKVYSGDIDL